MTKGNGDGHMTLRMSRSGVGCNMTTPNGKKNVYCNLQRLVEFVEGLNDNVPFTVTLRTETMQSELDNPGEKEEKG